MPNGAGNAREMDESFDSASASSAEFV